MWGGRTGGEEFKVRTLSLLMINVLPAIRVRTLTFAYLTPQHQDVMLVLFPWFLSWQRIETHQYIINVLIIKKDFDYFSKEVWEYLDLI